MIFFILRTKISSTERRSKKKSEEYGSNEFREPKCSTSTSGFPAKTSAISRAQPPSCYSDSANSFLEYESPRKIFISTYFHHPFACLDHSTIVHSTSSTTIDPHPCTAFESHRTSLSSTTNIQSRNHF